MTQIRPAPSRATTFAPRKPREVTMSSAVRLRVSCAYAVMALLGGLASVADASVPDPTVSGPVTGGYGQPVGGMRFDVAQYGYQENEYFFEGTAKAYGTTAPSAPYRSRMIVWTPADPASFNGTTV